MNPYNVDTLADAIQDNQIAYDQLEVVVRSGNKLTARAIRNAVMPARAQLEFSIITNAEYYAAAALVFPNIAALSATEEQSMSNANNAIPFQSIDYVYGRDINTLSKADLMGNIKRAKAEIKDLQDVGVDSSFITDQVAGLVDAINKMVARLDA